MSAEGRKMSRKFTVRIDCMEDIFLKNQQDTNIFIFGIMLAYKNNTRHPLLSLLTTGLIKFCPPFLK